MKVLKAFAALTICTLSSLAIADSLSPRQVKAQGAPSYTQGAYCSNATLRGLYALHDSGFRGKEAPFTPYNAVRTANFDANGNTSGSGFR